MEAGIWSHVTCMQLGADSWEGSAKALPGTCHLALTCFISWCFLGCSCVCVVFFQADVVQSFSHLFCYAFWSLGFNNDSKYPKSTMLCLSPSLQLRSNSTLMQPHNLHTGVLQSLWQLLSSFQPFSVLCIPPVCSFYLIMKAHSDASPVQKLRSSLLASCQAKADYWVHLWL